MIVHCFDAEPVPALPVLSAAELEAAEAAERQKRLDQMWGASAISSADLAGVGGGTSPTSLANKMAETTLSVGKIAAMAAVNVLRRSNKDEL